MFWYMGLFTAEDDPWKTKNQEWRIHMNFSGKISQPYISFLLAPAHRTLPENPFGLSIPNAISDTYTSMWSYSKCTPVERKVCRERVHACETSDLGSDVYLSASCYCFSSASMRTEMKWVGKPMALEQTLKTTLCPRAQFRALVSQRDLPDKPPHPDYGPSAFAVISTRVQKKETTCKKVWQPWVYLSSDVSWCRSTGSQHSQNVPVSSTSRVPEKKKRLASST